MELEFLNLQIREMQPPIGYQNAKSEVNGCTVSRMAKRTLLLPGGKVKLKFNII